MPDTIKHPSVSFQPDHLLKHPIGDEESTDDVDRCDDQSQRQPREHPRIIRGHVGEQSGTHDADAGDARAPWTSGVCARSWNLGDEFELAKTAIMNSVMLRRNRSTDRHPITPARRSCFDIVPSGAHQDTSHALDMEFDRCTVYHIILAHHERIRL